MRLNGLPGDDCLDDTGLRDWRKGQAGRFFEQTPKPGKPFMPPRHPFLPDPDKQDDGRKPDPAHLPTSWNPEL